MSPDDIQSILLTWSQLVLVDYIDASLLPPICDCDDAWQDGLAFLALLHCHDPDSAQDLPTFLTKNDDRSQWRSRLDTAFRRAEDAFGVPVLLDPVLLADAIRVDRVSIMAYLMEFIRRVNGRHQLKDIRARRKSDIEQWQNATATEDDPPGDTAALTATPSSSILSNTASEEDDEQPYTTRMKTVTSTYSVQQLRVTKTTRPGNAATDDEEFDSRVTSILEKIAHLHNRLMFMIPTRSSHYHRSATMRSRSLSSASSMMTPELESSDETESHATTENPGETHLLHPLQAAEDDLRGFEKNFAAFQVMLQAFTNDELAQFHYYVEHELDPVWRQDNAMVASRTAQVDQAYRALLSDADKCSHQLAAFQRGFLFGQRCLSVRNELDYVQAKIVKTTSASSETDIEEMEMRVERAASMIQDIFGSFQDLVVVPGGEDTHNVPKDEAYQVHIDALTKRNNLVRTWVEEVRVWFAEAQRIRQWINIREQKLEEITVPEPLAQQVSTTKEEVDQLNAAHNMLQKEIEAFNENDMARLRAHVKTLTNANRSSKDLSPADTTTIEITLTTVNALERLMHSLRRKGGALSVLNLRLLWQAELEKTNAWLRDADQEVEEFIRNSARWHVAEDDWQRGGDEGQDMLHREQLMAKERLKELVIQRLLMLEQKKNEFDQGQFTTTVDAFRDMEDTATVNIPRHLEKQQVDCEQRFEDLSKRISFARQVVEQRLKVMDFLYQVHLVWNDAEQLMADMQEAQDNVKPEDNDREITGRVQAMHERIVQLVTTAAARIPYPFHALDVDKTENEESNAAIRELISSKREELVLLGENLDHALHALRHVLQLHRCAKQLLDDATRLSEWADNRLKNVQKAKMDASVDASLLSIEDVSRFERDRDNLLEKLKNGKENETIDVLTKIQNLLEAEEKTSGPSSIDRESLEDASQYLMNVFDRLRETLDELGEALAAVRKTKEDGNNYVETMNTLRAFVNETRASLPGLKQSCGFMTGQSEEQDRQRLEMLNTALEKLAASYYGRSRQLDALRSGFRTLKKDKVDNPNELKAEQEKLEKDWQQLGMDMQELESFAEGVKAWYQRQRRLSMVENGHLAGLNEEIAELTKAGWTDADLDKIEAKVKEALKILDATGKEISQAARNRDDPLETANYACARDRQVALVGQAQTVLKNLNALRKNANDALAFSAFLAEADHLFGDVQERKEEIHRRMAVVGSSDFAAKGMDEIEKTFVSVQNNNAASEAQVQNFQQRLKQLERDAQALRLQGYDEQSVRGPIRRIEDSLGQLVNTIAVEKRQAAFVRKTKVYAKAASDLLAWMGQCGNAMSQMSTDVCVNDEAEVRAEMEVFESKLSEIQPTIRAFQAMAPRILAGRDGQPLDLREIRVDPDQVKDALKAKEEAVLNEWNQLLRRLEEAKSALQASRQDVEIARKIKEIVMLVGHLKERANALQLGGTFTEEVLKAAEQNDLKLVTTCPLSMMPIEPELLAAKTELDSLERDKEQFLQTRLQELDTMLGKNADREGTFAGQRAEIAAAVRSLVDIMRMKRDAIAAAEKLETFLTVVEELEVMLSALGEVIERASPKYARIVDGAPSRVDLQAMLIDLDTRYRYYEPKIVELVEEADEVALPLATDKRVVDCMEEMKRKWAQLQALAAARRADLQNRVGTLPPLNLNSRLAQESLGRRAALTKRASMPVFDNKPMPNQSTPRPGTARGYRPKSALAPKPARTASTTTRKLPPARPSPTPRQRADTSSPETYVADPKNDLDVAVGNIVNDSPYRVRVKMVPGEVGKYWFGTVNPKLAYCRILRSRMVMVRVGGGWVELSQFLRDHALLEQGNFVPRHQVSITDSPEGGNGIREGMLRTEGGIVCIRGGAAAGGIGGLKRGPTPLRESRSTPFRRGLSPGSFGHGIKDGNKFLVPVDNEGNQVEVRMTKAKSKNTNFITPWRTRQ